MKLIELWFFLNHLAVPLLALFQAAFKGVAKGKSIVWVA